MTSKVEIHVVNKADIADKSVVSIQSPDFKPLEDGHVRARTFLIALTTNNLSYARNGTTLKWWDAYPTTNLPEPYNNETQYGIVPAWGYGEILESRVPGIEAGMLLWGFWPTSQLPVDLKLAPADIDGHWVETSDHRKNIMSLYQRYHWRDSALRSDSVQTATLQDMAWQAAMLPWEAGYLLNKSVFGKPPIHPAGVEPWTENDADLRSAVVISLSASGKTARGFTHALINERPAHTGPLGLLAITSSSRSDFLPKAKFPTTSVSYQAAAADETMSWIESEKPQKLVIADFGGRGDSLQQLLQALQQRFGDKQEIVIIGVGGGGGVRTQEDLKNWAQKAFAIPNRIQMNTSPLKDTLMAQVGAQAYFEDLERAWKRFIKSESTSDLKLEMGEGVSGNNGLEGGWRRLNDGTVPGDVALGYRV